EVRMVLGGEGTVTVTVNGQEREFEVSGTPNSYSIIPMGGAAKGTLEVTLSPGLEAYSFTFG
ncbi:MAG TPA: cytochrome c biogenesis protein DipZ, partial [Rhodoglobus sp.]|nr:cytochrome c biogenesis protein DipZ [Rhodoglobus sp.]